MTRPRNFFVGVDLGQANDYTAICVIEQVSERAEDGSNELRYRVGHLERMELGTRYPAQVERIKERLDHWRGRRDGS